MIINTLSKVENSRSKKKSLELVPKNGRRNEFTRLLMRWNQEKNTRVMPWKGEKDPYKIWLSEIILQQTRVEQGWAYYLKFLESYPDIFHLAKTPEKKLFKLWEGLGYYNRCSNLLDTARKIVRENNGVFPDNYEDVLLLKGIGPYTAAAIMSFAFNQPYAVVDGNVQRVLARYFGLGVPTDNAAGKKLFEALACELLDRSEPGRYNQAIMDFGATVCRPLSPLCHDCSLAAGCVARNQDRVEELPFRAKKLRKKIRWFLYFFVETAEGMVFIRRRNEKDIWKNLYEFMLWESLEEISESALRKSGSMRSHFGNEKVVIRQVTEIQSQQLTHQQINGRIVVVRLNAGSTFRLHDYHLVRKTDLDSYPFPKLIKQLLQSVDSPF